MGWFPKRPGRERILLYGNAGTGKSSAAISIARRIDGTVHVIDTDYAMDAMLFGDDVPSNIEPHPVDMDDWDGLIKTVTDVMKAVDKDDWVVIDSMTPTWDAVQSYYVEKIHSKDIDVFFVEERKRQSNASSFQAMEGWKDYSVINKVYAKFYKLIHTCKCHVLLTAEAQPVNTSEGKTQDSREIRDLFQRIGQKPKGQKRLPFIPHTVIYMRKRGKNDYQFTTVKDRNREDQVDSKMTDFAMDYLFKVAGWRPRRAA